MAKTVAALYDDFITAQRAVQDLYDVGFTEDDISMVVNNTTGEFDKYATPERERHVARVDTEPDRVTRGEEAGISAGAGAVVGGLGGFLLSLGMVTIPGVGPALAAGPIAATLAGAGIGAATGGLSGWLFNAGVPEEEAGYYVEGVRRGGTLVVVTTADAQTSQAINILKHHHPVDIRRRAIEWNAAGQPVDDVGVEPYPSENIEREHEYHRRTEP